MDNRLKCDGAEKQHGVVDIIGSVNDHYDKEYGDNNVTNLRI